MTFNNISEDFVQFVWKFSLFDKQGLISGSGEKIQVIYPGEQNAVSGPDFYNSKLLIDDSLWVGTVEIHKDVKTWRTHKHQHDGAYNNLILHVVLEGPEDEVQVQSGRWVSTLRIGERIFNNTIQTYKSLIQSKPRFIPCQDVVDLKEEFVFIHLYNRLSLERLSRKVQEIERDLSNNQGDIESSFVTAIFKHFGSPLNKDPFEILSRSFTNSQLIKQCSNLEQLESFLFGLANLLHNQDDYSIRLLNEFIYTKRSYQLVVHCNFNSWKFKGGRPTSFPTKRLAELSALLYKNPRPFQSMIKAQSIEELYDLFEIEVSDYWMQHYSFGKIRKKGTKSLTKSFKNKLIINVVVPFLFFYGKHIDKEEYVDRALHFLEQLKAESNHLIDGYKEIGFSCKNALESQALIQLKNEYCKPKRCLDCGLAFHLLKRN